MRTLVRRFAWRILYGKKPYLVVWEPPDGRGPGYYVARPGAVIVRCADGKRVRVR